MENKLKNMKNTGDLLNTTKSNIAIKQHSEDILLEVPAIHAAPQVIGDAPYHAEKLRTLPFLS